MQWSAIIWAGFIATTLAASLLWVSYSLRAVRVAPGSQLGCLFLKDPRSPLTETVGILLLFALGSTVVPAAYAWVFDVWGRPSWLAGFVLGAMHGIVAVALVPVVGLMGACVRAGLLPPPGWLGTGWGVATPAVLLAAHVLYGVVVGAVLAAFS